MAPNINAGLKKALGKTADTVVAKTSKAVNPVITIARKEQKPNPVAAANNVTANISRAVGGLAKPIGKALVSNPAKRNAGIALSNASKVSKPQAAVGTSRSPIAARNSEPSFSFGDSSEDIGSVLSSMWNSNANPFKIESAYADETQEKAEDETAEAEENSGVLSDEEIQAQLEADVEKKQEEKEEAEKQAAKEEKQRLEENPWEYDGTFDPMSFAYSEVSGNDDWDKLSDEERARAQSQYWNVSTYGDEWRDTVSDPRMLNFLLNEEDVLGRYEVDNDKLVAADDDGNYDMSALVDKNGNLTNEGVAIVDAIIEAYENNTLTDEDNYEAYARAGWTDDAIGQLAMTYAAASDPDFGIMALYDAAYNNPDMYSEEQFELAKQVLAEQTGMSVDDIDKTLKHIYAEARNWNGIPTNDDRFFTEEEVEVNSVGADGEATTTPTVGYHDVINDITYVQGGDGNYYALVNGEMDTIPVSEETIAQQYFENKYVNGFAFQAAQNKSLRNQYDSSRALMGMQDAGLYDPNQSYSFGDLSKMWDEYGKTMSPEEREYFESENFNPYLLIPYDQGNMGGLGQANFYQRNMNGSDFDKDSFYGLMGFEPTKGGSLTWADTASYDPEAARNSIMTFKSADDFLKAAKNGTSDYYSALGSIINLGGLVNDGGMYRPVNSGLGYEYR